MILNPIVTAKPGAAKELIQTMDERKSTLLPITSIYS